MILVFIAALVYVIANTFLSPFTAVLITVVVSLIAAQIAVR